MHIYYLTFVQILVDTSLKYRDTPVPSPTKRASNVPANKRVEMLRSCEVDMKREAAKTQIKATSELENVIHTNRKNAMETIPVPNSPVKIAQPKIRARCSPRKTHLTNFMSQNMMYADLLRKQHVDIEDSPATTLISVPDEHHESKMKRSPCLQFNALGVDIGKQLLPPKSPRPRRRISNHSTRDRMDDSDTDSEMIKGNDAAVLRTKDIDSLSRCELEPYAIDRFNRCRLQRQPQLNKVNKQCKIAAIAKESLNIDSNGRHFHSIDVTNRNAEIRNKYCPQSEPVKRKIYSENLNNRLQCSIDMETGILRI